MRKSLLFLLVFALIACVIPLANAATTTQKLYFNTGSNTAAGVTAYLLDTDYTNTAQFINSSQAGAQDVSYGYRVYLVTSNTSIGELTPGTQQAIVTLSSNTTGQVTSTWVVATTNTVLGYQALEIVVYEQYGSSGWLSRATFITPVLITSQIVGATWTFTLYVNYTLTVSDTYTGFLFGTGEYQSCVSGVQLLKPTENQIQSFRMGNGDVVGFIIGAYTDVIGVGAYLLVLLGLTGALYFNYRHIGVVLFVFAMFGGSGGVIWVFIPSWAAVVVDAILLVGFAALLYKVTRG
jgi:uncharacterized protein YcfL